jgi:hypothetical protein
MIPKSHKMFKEGISDEVKVHQSVVDEFIAFYYKKLRESLSSLEDDDIFVDGLGTFSLRKSRVEKAIIKNKSYLGNLEKITYNGYNKTIIIQEKIDVLEKALAKIQESIDLRQEFKKKKYETKH